MGPREIIIIAVIVVLLFGAPKLPELARSIGKSMRILKDETKSLADDGKDDDARAAGDGKGASDAPSQARRQQTTDVPQSTVDLPDDEARGT
ncbi:Sec-independent protein translocase subunit TatA [Demequina sp. NBRC 110053]|uniref:Sec-independent protein translocase subunit TatA n=1 Tax=Demequina sp. NBRC 110053 TaxID=1570342 RepID=UPI0009FE1C35|nr:Sec-independent protein translocase subunit TatA [Demequina sp. NBRC 110053]